MEQREGTFKLCNGLALANQKQEFLLMEQREGTFRLCNESSPCGIKIWEDLN